MIIEWIGCSGTGKSTLCRGVYKNLLSSGINVRRPLEIFLGRSIAKAVSNESVRNLSLDLLILPWSLASAIKYREFLKYCIQILDKDCPSLIQKLLLLRSILRKTGLHVFLSSFCNEKQPILVDEGTVHIAHLLFANGSKKYISEKEISEFCLQAPTPDLIVHIMATQTEIIKRTLDRKDKPIPNTSPDSLKSFLVLGHQIYKIFNDVNPWQKKTITISNPDSSSKNRGIIISNITNQIKNGFPSIKF